MESWCCAYRSLKPRTSGHCSAVPLSSHLPLHPCCCHHSSSSHLCVHHQPSSRECCHLPSCLTCGYSAGRVSALRSSCWVADWCLGLVSSAGIEGRSNRLTSCCKRRASVRLLLRWIAAVERQSIGQWDLDEPDSTRRCPNSSHISLASLRSRAVEHCIWRHRANRSRRFSWVLSLLFWCVRSKEESFPTSRQAHRSSAWAYSRRWI